jgi:hypothetical protein
LDAKRAPQIIKVIGTTVPPMNPQIFEVIFTVPEVLDPIFEESFSQSSSIEPYMLSFWMDFTGGKLLEFESLLNIIIYKN